ncbi:MAG: hypothetical protein IT335_14900 [Thermomicrobiales bacterium]|nr:hypothetical protein [Thermomicrobiales bacterium]
MLDLLRRAGDEHPVQHPLHGLAGRGDANAPAIPVTQRQVNVVGTGEDHMIAADGRRQFSRLVNRGDAHRAPVSQVASTGREQVLEDKLEVR